MDGGVDGGGWLAGVSTAGMLSPSLPGRIHGAPRQPLAITRPGQPADTLYRPKSWPTALSLEIEYNAPSEKTTPTRHPWPRRE